jgi:hypothetical protein
MAELTRALAAVERNSDREALEAMLIAWRGWREPRLADLIDALAQLTGDAGPWRTHWFLVGRGEWDLAVACRDPRLARRLAEGARQEREPSDSLVRDLTTIGDRRVAEILARWPDLAQRLRELPVDPPPPDANVLDALEDACRRRVERERERATERAALIASVRAQPGDRARLPVVIDRLHELGDPRASWRRCSWPAPGRARAAARATVCASSSRPRAGATSSGRAWGSGTCACTPRFRRRSRCASGSSA